jgi:hypothetical protein
VSVARVALLPLILTLAGCRAVIGIEPLELADAAGASPASDGGGDVGPALTDASDANTDAADAADAASADTGPPLLPDGGVCTKALGPDCFMCCHQGFGTSFNRYEELARETACICGTSGLCTSTCSSAICAQPPAPPPPPMGCAVCVDSALTGSTQACLQAAGLCDDEADCRNASRCLQFCR